MANDGRQPAGRSERLRAWRGKTYPLKRLAMKRSRVAMFGIVLAAATVAAVAGVVAQSRPDPAPAPAARGRVLMLDGRGGQLGVVVRDLDADGLKNAAGAASGVRID